MAMAAVKLYSDLCKAPDDESRARLIAEAFEEIEHRYPEVKDLATQSGIRESELRLQVELEKIRKESKESEGRLQLEIEGARKEIRETEGRLQLEIRESEGRLRLEIEGVRREIKETEGRLQIEIEKVKQEIKEVEVRLVTSIHRQTIWVIGAMGAMLGILRFLDTVLK